MGCCTLWPELQAGFRADVGRPDVETQYLCGLTGTDRPAGMTGGEAVGGEDGGGGAGGGDAGVAMMATGSRADVDRPGSRLRRSRLPTLRLDMQRRACRR